LKPDNVLIDDNDIPKICDFGLSAYEQQIEGGNGTPIYRFV